MPIASIIVPAFNVAASIGETLDSLLAQTAPDYEIIVVNDGSTDDTMSVIEPYLRHPNLRVVLQGNRGLAGARNTGIAHAKGLYVGFCDADDLWLPTKLATHIDHLRKNPDVGVSYSGSALIADDGSALGMSQSPKLRGITPADILKRNPIGNGSAAVFRKKTLTDIAYRPAFEGKRDWVFDETFRQSEDIECWLRLALTTDWQFEGVSGLLTKYRVNSSGLSAALERQLDSWERAVAKLRPLSPGFFKAHEDAARAYQLRYLARRAISNERPHTARAMLRSALQSSTAPIVEEPVKTLSTLVAAFMPSSISTSSIALLRSLKSLSFS